MFAFIPSDLTFVVISCKELSLTFSDLCTKSWKGDSPPRDRSELRNCIQIEPLPISLSKSSDTSAADYYGTRLSTVILVRRDGQTVFVERDIWTRDEKNGVKKADTKSQRHFRFHVLR